MARELRCDGTLHGVMLDDHTLEVKCTRRKCGVQPGIIVLHRFNLASGEVSTVRYKDPRPEGRSNNGAGHEPARLRPA